VAKTQRGNKTGGAAAVDLLKDIRQLLIWQEIRVRQREAERGEADDASVIEDQILAELSMGR
jgi:hypothetical protein